MRKLNGTFLLVPFFVLSLQVKSYGIISELIDLGQTFFGGGNVAQTSSMLADIVKMANILSEIKVIQGGQRDDIRSIYDHFQSVSSGDDFKRFMRDNLSYDAQLDISAAKEGSKLLGKYTGNDIYGNTEDSIDGYILSLKPTAPLSQQAKDNIASIDQDLNSSAQLSETGRQNLQVKQNAQTIKNQVVGNDIAKQQLAHMDRQQAEKDVEKQKTEVAFARQKSPDAFDVFNLRFLR